MSKALAVFLLLMASYLSAQHTMPVFRGGSFYDFMHMVGNKELAELDSICADGYTMVKFRIDTTGKVIDFACSAGTPKRLIRFFQERLQESENLWCIPLNTPSPTYYLGSRLVFVFHRVQFMVEFQ